MFDVDYIVLALRRQFNNGCDAARRRSDLNERSERKKTDRRQGGDAALPPELLGLTDVLNDVLNKDSVVVSFWLVDSGKSRV
jgi:hypothetical protein